MGATQLPMLYFVWHLGAPAWLAVALFVASTLAILRRVRYLPSPEPPPVWFEKWVTGSYFLYSIVGLYFTPGLLIGWLLDWPVKAGAAWLIASILLALRANGIPIRPVAVRRVDVPVKDLPQAFDGLTIAHMTDLHAGPFCSQRRLNRWVRLVNRESPDLVCLTGDFIASGSRWVPSLEIAFAGLRPRLGTYACMGNHDYFEPGDGGTITAMFERLEIKVLANEHVILERDGAQLALAGIGDTWRVEDDVAGTLGAVPDGLATLLLAHDPETFPTSVEHGVGLQLSGHLHGGQMAVPFLGRMGSVLMPFMDYVQGLYFDSGSAMYLSAGLGTTGAPVRIGMLSELPILRLKCG
jgi:predicted MPP superfamily phosphohydrolase